MARLRPVWPIVSCKIPIHSHTTKPWARRGYSLFLEKRSGYRGSMAWSTSDTMLNHLHCCCPRMLSRRYQRRCFNERWQMFTNKMARVRCCLIRLQSFRSQKLAPWHENH